MLPKEVIQAVVIDDNIEFLEAIVNMLKEFECIKIIGTASSVEEGKDSIIKLEPDVVFLDVELSGGTGFDILKDIEEINFDIIFTTAYEHYALTAIKFSALDYLLKPFGKDDLKEAIDKLEERKYHNSTPVKTLLSNILQQNSQQKRLGLNTQEGIYFYELKDIIRCKAFGNYTEFHIAGDKKYIVSTSIKKYTELLEDNDFYRVHNSHLINLKHVASFLKSDGGSIVMSDGANIDIARNRKNYFLELLSQL